MAQLRMEMRQQVEAEAEKLVEMRSRVLAEAERAARAELEECKRYVELMVARMRQEQVEPS